MSVDQNLLFAFSLAQGGEFAFVLFSFAAQNGVVDTTTTQTLVAVVAISMTVTPLLMLFNEKLLQPRFGTREHRSDVEPDTMKESKPVIIAGFGRVGGIVGRLLRANGVGTTVLEFDSDHVDLLRKLGLEVYYGDASRLDLLRSAGADEAKVILVALDDQARSMSLIETVQKHFPNQRFSRGRVDESRPTRFWIRASRTFIEKPSTLLSRWGWMRCAPLVSAHIKHIGQPRSFAVTTRHR